MNSRATSVTRLRLHRSTVVGWFVLWREIYHRAILDFCNTICQNRTHAPQQTTYTERNDLFDHLVGSREQRLWYIEAERPSADYSWRRWFLGGERRLNRPDHV